jgi:hypothetical protein
LTQTAQETLKSESDLPDSASKIEQWAAWSDTQTRSLIELDRQSSPQVAETNSPNIDPDPRLLDMANIQSQLKHLASGALPKNDFMDLLYEHTQQSFRKGHASSLKTQTKVIQKLEIEAAGWKARSLEVEKLYGRLVKDGRRQQAELERKFDGLADDGFKADKSSRKDTGKRWSKILRRDKTIVDKVTKKDVVEETKLERFQALDKIMESYEIEVQKQYERTVKVKTGEKIRRWFDRTKAQCKGFFRSRAS